MDKPRAARECPPPPPAWVLTGAGPRPLPPSDWNEPLARLTKLTVAPQACPAHGARIETHTEPGTVSPDLVTDSGFIFHLTMAGWGQHQADGAAPTVLTPGTAFVAATPTCCQWCLPQDSREWAFARLTAQHPYLASRVAALVEDCGPVLMLTPRAELAETALRLIDRALRNDFQDKFEAEFSLFEFVLTLERAAMRARHRCAPTARKPHTAV